MERNFRSAEELAAALRAGDVTSVELTDEAIGRIERDDKLINAICVRTWLNAVIGSEEPMNGSILMSMWRM
ncbi:hypothetical protein [Nocardia sp. NPDC049707]|uniref:hypothetical protein n=1 Tax=Nocardia sp. NPDC049707 TaxID=3154735 RepID=UPI00342E8EA1